VSDIIADLKAEADEADLREANLRLLRQLDKEKRNKADVVEAVYKAVTDNLHSLTFPPSVHPPSRRQAKGGETAIVTFSDLQLGQVTATYNSDIAEQRVALYADRVLRLVDLQRSDHPVRKGKVYLLGDLIEGELIVPSHPHQVDSSVYAQVALNGPRILTDFIRRMASAFPDGVDVVSVPGNHGDVGGPARKMYNPETNFDRMLSTIVRHVFEASGERRVTFRIPDGYGRSSWYAVDYVGDVGFHLWHGHQARRSSSSSHLPFYKLVLGWAAGAIPEPFSVSICGHHHVPTMLSIGTRSLFINGTFASDSEYAVERLASNAKVGQWLLFAQAGRGLTAQYLVDVG
jgi:hypothetical protein